MSRNLTDKVIIITGGSSGIGAATAIECARWGMDVVLNARRAERLNVVAQEIRKLGRKAEIVAGCVTEPGLSQRLIEVAERTFGGHYAVFANAGYGLERPMVKVTQLQLREMFDVNFFSGVELLQASAAQLISKKQPGHLLMCSSCLARLTLPNYGLYCATKAAQNHVCRAMNAELAHRGIHVSSVHPVTTMTEFFDVSAQVSGLTDGHPRSSDHAPRMFRQSPQRVARAVVACLRRPRPEVWTSFTVRLGAGLMTIFPRLGALVMNTMERPRRAAMDALVDIPNEESKESDPSARQTGRTANVRS